MFSVSDIVLASLYEIIRCVMTVTVGSAHDLAMVNGITTRCSKHWENTLIITSTFNKNHDVSLYTCLPNYCACNLMYEHSHCGVYVSPNATHAIPGSRSVCGPCRQRKSSVPVSAPGVGRIRTASIVDSWRLTGTVDS